MSYEPQERGDTVSEDAHEHDWKLPEGGYFVIGTLPPQYPYQCECGAFTHNPDSGAPCRICAPDDYQRRSPDLVTLIGGTYNGATIVRPVNQSVHLRVDPVDRRVQKFDTYKQTEDRDVWKFYSNDWTVAFQPREVRVRAGE